MTRYVDADFAPAQALFLLEFDNEDTTEVFALRVLPDATNTWSGDRAASQDPRKGMQDLMTGFLDERLRAAGLEETVRGFSSEAGEPGVFVLHHEIRGEHLDGQAVEPLVQRWRTLLVEELRQHDVPASEVAPVHRLSANERRLMGTPLALANALAQQETLTVAIPSRDALFVRRAGRSDPILHLVLRVQTEEGGWGVMGLPLDAVTVEPWTPTGQLQLLQEAFFALQAVSQEHPGTVRWESGHELGPIDLGFNLRGRGDVQGADVNDIPVATLASGTAMATLERMQSKLHAFTNGHTGVVWCVAPGSDAARNLDVLILETRQRLADHQQADVADVAPGTGRKPGGR